ncbi:hypothetical protein [Aliiglaciecola sp. LCG003]|uniref:hypothetical protein n=1 Tax=Aliiglaciecola sp. LCG003 TaxID=3053655 RepID=UPI0025728F4A|nr:hypothetical protein [Aliiglaciecola sp. LCG003]WJG10131.1 hypothetical protein QR722_03575 [Aliiglaciecola sp. LCG003]
MNTTQNISGEFVTLNGERFYKIVNVDQMPAFFISVVSNSDHWLFASSNGGLTAGRVSPETALFPYVTVDKIYESTPHTGCKTVLHVSRGKQTVTWEPFNYQRQHDFQLLRNLFKNTLGNKLCFEEINHSLQLMFRYTWTTSEEFGFCRQAELCNLSDQHCEIDILDGLINLLPAGTPRFTQTQSSNLVDAYKFNELDEATGLAMFTLYSGITDRAEPAESLHATSVFTLGLEPEAILLSEQQIAQFIHQQSVNTESSCRGVRGAYLIQTRFKLRPKDHKQWFIVADLEQTQSQVSKRIVQLSQPDVLQKALLQSVQQGSDDLARIMASSDGFQYTNEENVTVHHYANTLFNVLRGGIFDQQYQITAKDLCSTVSMFNQPVFAQNRQFLQALPATMEIQALLQKVSQHGDGQLERLVMEYLPITFGRRHGDPSRPWNQFAINLKDKQGNPLLSYQGNWRDIFQNWEALTFSYPDFIESVIAKFVNASTMDGYNPYRITKQGIDWEVEEPDDPWSYIGYWGDHQIIYLLKMLELSNQFHPQKLSQLLSQPLFSYANVPYKIKDFDDIVLNAKSTVSYDDALAEVIEKRVSAIGADGKLVLDGSGQVYQVNLLEKLLVPLLSKLSNLVVDGGIWLNTQRPEWNDANNALVGQGLSMVTLYYMRRYVTFLQHLLQDTDQLFTLSNEVNQWLVDISMILADVAQQLDNAPVTDSKRFEILERLGRAGCRYRQAIYQQQGFSGQVEVSVQLVNRCLLHANDVINHSININRADDGLYQAYNLLQLSQHSAHVSHLYPMLEGQVAALSSGAITGKDAVNVLEALFNSDVFRADINTFMLYPDRKQTRFLDKNVIPADGFNAIPLLQLMLDRDDNRIVSQDCTGRYRFNSELTNSGDLTTQLHCIGPDYAQLNDVSQQAILDLYEQVFEHKSFTGRSGGMFGFEGLGSVYWHMVAKLLLAVKEQYFYAIDTKLEQPIIQRLGELYYQVREGIGFNKTPQQYGAFPTDPYSHTPKHAGAQQPGMTGQVKEEVMSRFAELGIHVANGQLQINPALLRAQEFCQSAGEMTYLDVAEQWQTIEVPSQGLAFTWCQVPIVYQLAGSTQSSVSVYLNDGTMEKIQINGSQTLALNHQLSEDIFKRNGRVVRIECQLSAAVLYQEKNES